jgi:NAD(P)-dependent dehydrogenase (short-subunit alcohol dehydrogenase family)
VNAIVSATIISEMLERNLANAPEGVLEAGAARHPLGYGTPADITNAVLFLISDASRWITGTSMAVDGGYLA